MSWSTYHSRSDVLRAVAEQAERRRDGILPTDVPGADPRRDGAAFHETRDLVGALQFRWRNRLVACLEQRLELEHPDIEHRDLESAVREAWADAASALPGLRAVLDAQLEHPADDAVADAMARATAKEHQLLAAMAGRGGRLEQRPDAQSVAVGRAIESAARESLLTRPPVVEREPRGSASFVRRLRAALAA